MSVHRRFPAQIVQLSFPFDYDSKMVPNSARLYVKTAAAKDIANILSCLMISVLMILCSPAKHLRYDSSKGLMYASQLRSYGDSKDLNPKLLFQEEAIQQQTAAKKAEEAAQAAAAVAATLPDTVQDCSYVLVVLVGLFIHLSVVFRF